MKKVNTLEGGNPLLNLNYLYCAMYKASFFVHKVLPAEMEIPYLDSG